MLIKSLCICLLTAVVGICEAKELRGLVVDAETGVALEDVQIRSGVTETTSGRSGRFTISAVRGDSLYFTRFGYEESVSIVNNEEDLLQVALKADVFSVREVVVTGGLQTESLSEIPASVSVLSADKVEKDGVQHIQGLVNSVSNLHWAGGTARPRYFQMRGIGERSQYAGEGPPNFSVGFVVDGIDLSGLGTGALFDLQQVEVFKGPQSSAFGANALAGLINVQSAEASSTAERTFRFGMGGDGLLRMEGVLNQPINDRLALRASFQSARSNGFRENVFLDAEDSNKRLEESLRLKMRYVAPSGLLLKGALFRVDADNGYDMWAPDNNEELFTYTNQPGDDHQTTTAASIRAEKLFTNSLNIISISTYSQTDLNYSYDGDWGNDSYWLGEPYLFNPDAEGYSYDFFDRTKRERTSWSQELRLESGVALLGVYARSISEQDDAAGYLFGGSSTDLQASFDMRNVAFYGQLENQLAENIKLISNVRLERSGIEYDGKTNGGSEAVRYDVAHLLSGGKVSLSWQNNKGSSAYAAVARGYRAGGINQHPYLSSDNRPYDPEHMLNFEFGLRRATQLYHLSLVSFYAFRDDQQVSLSSQQNPGDPNSFFFFTANASSGYNRGVELEGRYSVLPGLDVFASLGFLDTHVDEYSFNSAQGQLQRLGGRATAHAPQWNTQVGGSYANNEGFFARVSWSFKDRFYFSDSHNQRAESHQIVNGSVGFEKGIWELTLWGHNLLDELYAVRGFYFGLTPPDYADTLYVSYGDPRQVGLSLGARF